MTTPFPDPLAAPEHEAAGLRRGFAFLLLTALVVMGVVVDEGLGATGAPGSWVPRPLPDPEPQAVVSRPGTLSATWYCAEGTAIEGGRADEAISIANGGEEPLDAVVTVMRGAEPPVREAVEVAPRSRAQLRIADLVTTEEPGVVVEVFGPDAAVEHVLTGAGDLEALPCARRPATRWFFAGGSTLRDARDVLAIFNPFQDAATVDMTFFTEEGLEQPQALQSFEVPPQSRVSVPVHEHVLRRGVVAAELTTRSGRIVAERSLQFDGTTERRGMAVYLGVNDAAEEWTFPEGFVQGPVFEDVWVFNPGRAETEVEIQATLDGEALVEPVIAAVPGRSALTVRMNDTVPPDIGHSLRVAATGDEDVVVAQAIFSTPGALRTGSAVVSGLTEPATRWMLPAGSADATFDEWVTVLNPASAPVRVTVAVLAGGVLLVPEGLGDVEVAALDRRTIRLGDALKRTDLPLVVEARSAARADPVPSVYVVRGLFEADGVSYSPAIPFPAS